MMNDIGRGDRVRMTSEHSVRSFNVTKSKPGKGSVSLHFLYLLHILLSALMSSCVIDPKLEANDVRIDSTTKHPARE